VWRCINVNFIALLILRCYSFRDKLDATVQSCVECYTSNFVVARRRPAAAARDPLASEDEEEERLRLLDVTPVHDFEVDDTPDNTPDYEHVSFNFIFWVKLKYVN